MTVRSPEDKSNLAVFQRWATERGLSDIADHLLCTIYAQQTSKFLPDVIHFLISRNSDLTRWEESGHHTFGLAELSKQLIGQESSATHGGRRLLSNPTLSDFEQSQDTQYLQMALVSNSPKANPSSTIDQYQNFRLWILLEALTRAAEGVILDQNLRIVSKVVRQAGEDQNNKKWRPFLMSILGFHETPTAIRLHLLSTGAKLLEGPAGLTRGTAKYEFVEAVVAVARGVHSDYTKTIGETPKRPTIYKASTERDQGSDVTEIDDFEIASDDDDQEDQTSPSHLGQGITQVGTVDPAENSQEQDLQLTSVALTNAAKARLVTWDWECINPIERVQLQRRIRLAYKDTLPQTRLIAAVTEICLRSGRSMNIGLRIKIGISPPLSGDWCLDITSGELKRNPPRRKSHAKLKEKWAHLVPDEAEAICIRLTKLCIIAIGDAFKSHATNTEITLNDLFAASREAPTQLFLNWLRSDECLWRISPGMLGSVAQSADVETHEDWLQARLVYSQKNEALPAAGSYGCYRQKEMKGLNLSTLPVNQNHNAAGGRIDAPETFYQAGLEKLHHEIESLADSPDYIKFSNFVTVYWDDLLTCACGSRPGGNLWTWAHIDWDEHFALIDDKTGIDDHAVRWVPLPTDLLTNFETSYRGCHVLTICSLLIAEFGVNASQQARGMLESGLCVLIREDGGIVAKTINTNTRQCIGEFSALSPLVNNAYRHRARSEWRRRKLDLEIVDSFMSHGDGATRTHGDFSPRIWQQDAERARPIISATFEALNPKYPPKYRNAPKPFAELPTLPAELPVAVGTHSQKTVRRWSVLLKAARQAMREISSQIIQTNIEYLPKLQVQFGRLSIDDVRAGLSGLDEVRVRRLATTLTRTSSLTPSTLGELKLLWLSRMAEQVWEHMSVRVPLHKKAYRLLVKDAPTASLYGIGASKRFDQWKSQYAEVCKTLRRSEISAIDAATLTIVDLCIHSRIADCALLEDAALGKVKVVEYLDRYFLEWASGQAEIPDGRGVIRIRVTVNAAFYISVIQSKSVLRHTLLSFVSKVIEPLAIDLVGINDVSTLSLASLCIRLTRTTDALNCIELPGNIAAFRGGRIRTAALCWRDWLKLESGKDYDTRQENDALQTEKKFSAPTTDSLPITPLSVGSDEARRTAKSLFFDIRAEFSTLRKNGLSIKVTPELRKVLIRNLEKTIKLHAGKTSPAVQMLTNWCITLFDKRRTGKLLNPRSIARYFSALSPSFEALFHSIDLRVLDEDELTKALLQLFDKKKILHPEFVKDRLVEFISYCQEVHGLVAPNWHEIQVHDRAIGISPGYLTFSQYARLLVEIRYRSDLKLEDAVRGTIFAILGYRFGLRKGEAGGLRWIDWINVKGLIYVAVDSLRDRDVKHDSSRRTVPLLWRLTSFEKSILREHEALMREHVKSNPRALALSYPNDPTKPVDADHLASIVTSSLKTVGGRHLTDHHLRHTFAANVWHMLEQDDGIADNNECRARRLRIRHLMLQSNMAGRRTPWVIARLLGHAHPMQSYKSYIHFLCSYADALTFCESPSSKPPGAWGNLISLGKFPQYPRSVTQRNSIRSEVILPSARVVVLTLRQLGNGTPPQLVARSLHVSVQWVKTVQEALAGLEARIFPKANGADDRLESVEPSRKKTIRAEGEKERGSGSEKAFTFSKVGSSLLMSHLLISRIDSIAALLEASENAWSIRSLSALCDLEEFCESFGPRLQVSLWTKSQMDFFRWAVSTLGLSRDRLTLLRSKVLDGTVVENAIKTGWIGTPTMQKPTNINDLFPFTPLLGRQDTVRHGQYDARIDQRLSIQFESDEKLVVGSKFEFAFCLLVCWSWVQARVTNLQ